MEEISKSTKPGVEKIVIICPYLFELQRGVERYCLSLADAFLSRGIEVVIYTWVGSRRNACAEIDSRIKLRIVPNKRYYREEVARVFYKLWLLIDNPDITILNFMYHGEEYLPKKRPYLYILHSPASQIPQRYEYVSSKLLEFKRLRVIAISGMVKQEAAPYFPSIPTSLIYNGTDTEKFCPRKKARSEGKFRIITASAFEERKGIHLMLEALKDCEFLDRIEYHIYGTGDSEYENRLRSLIADYQLNKTVSLKGSVSNLSEIMPDYDLFALPSKGEALALSPIEAMACGLPVLVSNCPPYPEFVTPDFGFMVDRNNTDQIQEAIRTLIDNPEKLENMRVSARKKAETYSWQHVVDMYLEAIYQTI